MEAALVAVRRRLHRLLRSCGLQVARLRDPYRDAAKSKRVFGSE
jgi:hypothetical protein